MKKNPPFFSFTLTLIFSCLPIISLAQWTVSHPDSEVQGNSPMVWNMSVVDSSVVWASVTRSYVSGNSNDFFRTVNGGLTWEHKVVVGAAPTDVMGNLHALNADTAWAILWNTDNPDEYLSRVYKTADGGDTWEEKTLPFTGNISTALINIHFFNDSEGFTYAEAKDTAGWYIECYYTQDGGESWQLATVPEVPGERIFINWGNSNYAVIGDTAWFGASNSLIYRSIDKGVNWDTLRVPFFHLRGVGSVSFKDARNGIAATILSDSLGGFYALLEGLRTHDGGLTWERMPITDSSTLNRLFRMLGMTVVPGAGDVYIAYGYRQAGLLYQQLISYDAGETWSFMDGPYSRIRCMEFISPTVGWAGGWRYAIGNAVYPTIFKWTGPPLSRSKEVRAPEIQIDVSPNPVTDHLVVTIDAAPRELFQLHLMDLSGQLLQHIEIQGEISTSIDLHDLNEGIYLIKVFNEKGTAIGRVIKL